MYRIRAAHVQLAAGAEPQLTIYDSIFRYVCLVHGLGVGVPDTVWRRWFNLACFLVRLSIFAAKFSFISLTTPIEELSFAEITCKIGELVYSVAGFSAALQIAVGREDIQSGLRAKGRCFRSVVVPVICIGPYILLGMSSLSNAREVLYTIVESNAALTMASFFIIYTDLLLGVARRNRGIMISLQRQQEPSDLVSEKWYVRDGIKKINNLFSRILALYYVVFFMAVVYSFAELFGNRLHLTQKVLLSLGIVCTAFQLFEVARESSIMESISLQTEHLLSRRIGAALSLELTVYRFRDEWDSLRVAVFSHNVPNLLRFLGSGITCLGVILQFDYKMLKVVLSVEESGHTAAFQEYNSIKSCGCGARGGEG